MPTDNKKTKAMLYEHLRMEILSTRMAPGADIDEATLSAEFSLSRTPSARGSEATGGRRVLWCCEKTGLHV